jgi:ATP-dependent DNA helicase RecG
MTEIELQNVLNCLLSLPGETEIVEFKEAKNNYDLKKLGKYFSALANEANLCNKPSAWLIFGVQDNSHNIVGSNFRTNRKDLDSLKAEIAQLTTNKITFIEIYELITPKGRVVMLQIPAAPRGIPIASNGHYYGRDGESLVALNIEEQERIRNSIAADWSALVINSATINDLDEKAIEIARRNYISKHPDKAHEIKTWNTVTFLNKSKITIKDKITHTAILLLGKEEATHYINPAEAKLRWVLKDKNGTERDYIIETVPLLLAVDKVYNKIRNLTYRYIKHGTLFPEEVLQYEPYVIREAINNCIAHQDYTKGGVINIIEMEDSLIFTNYGTFIPGNVEKVIKDDAPEEQYRNKFLVTAMYNLKMVDTIGSGIKKMFNYQKERFFPLPEYDLSNSKIKVTITGKVLDMDYAKLLAQNNTLSLEDIIMLDKVQKKNRITDAEEKHLRSRNLIEGRKPNFFISLKVVRKTDLKAVYTKTKGLDNKYYEDLLSTAIEQHFSLNRQEIDELLYSKLPDWMTDKQKKTKITNIIAKLRIKGFIENTGSDFKPNWLLKNKVL